MDRTGTKLKSIQILRAFAAFVVLVSHLQKEIRRTVGPTLLDSTNVEIIGQAGVDLFFIISGFIMVYVTRDMNPTLTSSINFLIKRILRVVPLYWILTLLTLSISLLEPSVKYHNHVELSYSIGSFLFLPFPREDGHFTPLLGVGWTLNYEMLFYVLFCFVILTRSSRRLITLMAILVVFSFFGMFVDRSLEQIWFWTRPITLEFLMGGVLAHLFLRGITIPTPAALVMIGAGAVCLSLSGGLTDPTAYETRFWAWGIPSALIVGGIVLARKSPFDYLPSRLASLAERAGDGSYSLYLVHMFVIRIVTIALLKLQIPISIYLIVTYGTVLVVTLFVSDFLYRSVELTISRLTRRFLLPEDNT